MCIVVDLLEAADVRTDIRRRESLMRHFLTLALTPATLPRRVMQPPAKCLLVALSRRTHALAARLPGTWLGTIPLSAIATPAHPQLFVASRAVEQSIADVADRSKDPDTSSPQKAGQSLPITSLSPWDKRYQGSAHTSPKARGGNPRAFTFFRARPYYRARAFHKTRVAVIDTLCS